ncbi:hypothetical protein FOA52_015725 [Chlamydomonas sp. UWO 241]|nr:hypothetical protein FOA52_015725 [Chlamydomonas sp. UWO 241]
MADPVAVVKEQVKEEEDDVKEEQADVKADVKAEEAGVSAVPVDEAAVLERLREILKSANLEEVTEKMLRKKLEGEFGDLAHLKAAMRAEITAFLDAQAEPEEAEEEEAPKPKKKAGGFTKLCLLSPALAKVLGVERESRTQVVKKIWEYVRANNLQDPKDKRKIKADEALRPIFPCTVTMFSMNKHLAKHIFNDDDDACGGGGGAKKGSRKRKNDSDDEDEEDEEDDDDEDEEDEEDEGERKPPPKKRATPATKTPVKKEVAKKAVPKREVAKKEVEKKAGSGGGNNNFTKACTLSAELAAFVGKDSMSRPELTKFFTNYYKENDLQDPSDKRIVQCNATLKSLFQVDSFKSFGEIQRLLKPHITQ